MYVEYTIVRFRSQSHDEPNLPPIHLDIPRKPPSVHNAAVRVDIVPTRTY